MSTKVGYPHFFLSVYYWIPPDFSKSHYWIQVPQLRAAQNPLWRIRCLICQNLLIFCSLPQVVGADVLHEVRVQGSEETWPCPDSSVHLLQLEQLMPGGGGTGPG